MCSDLELAASLNSGANLLMLGVAVMGQVMEPGTLAPLCLCGSHKGTISLCGTSYELLGYLPGHLQADN